MPEAFKPFRHTGLALDPIHVGTGGTRLGRVDNTIVRDPVTRVPKIPGSSLAGVLRAYVAMAKGKYPRCAGQKDHCGAADCEVCLVFGLARGGESGGGFAGLAAFSDAHVLLFPVSTWNGPLWISSPMALRAAGVSVDDIGDYAVHRSAGTGALNLGWLNLEVKGGCDLQAKIKCLPVPGDVLGRLGLISDKLFSHIVNSNLEVRTSVAIDPETGAAEDKALFTYEAMPRGTVLHWEVTCRNPGHFKAEGKDVTVVKSADHVHTTVETGHEYLEHLGIGGMGTRGMGRLRVLGGK